MNDSTMAGLAAMTLMYDGTIMLDDTKKKTETTMNKFRLIADYASYEVANKLQNMLQTTIKYYVQSHNHVAESAECFVFLDLASSVTIKYYAEEDSIVIAFFIDDKDTVLQIGELQCRSHSVNSGTLLLLEIYPQDLENMVFAMADRLNKTFQDERADCLEAARVTILNHVEQSTKKKV